MAIDRIEKWKEIHQAAIELYSLAPWDYLEETDIFGVRTSVTGKTYFISIMGSAGQFLALSAYEGSRALERFWEMQSDRQDDPSQILLIPHLMLSFEDKNEVGKIQKEIVKESGVFSASNKKWPVVHQYIPGLMPAIPQGEYLDDMAEIIPQVIDVCLRSEIDIDLILPDEDDDETYLIREPVKTKGKTSWRDRRRKVKAEPETFKAIISQEDIEPLRFFRKTQTVYQADYRMVPAPVREEGNPEYFPFVIMLADKKSGIIAGHDMIPPLPDYHSMVESIPLIIVDLIKNLRLRPLRIEVRDQVLYELLKPAMARCEININLARTLASFEEAYKEMSKHFMKR